MSKQRKFWSTLPGILTGAAALITSVGGLIAILIQWDNLSSKDKPVAPAQPDQIEPSQPLLPSVLISNFEVNREDWKASGEEELHGSEPGYSPTEGNPGGCISVYDAGVGGDVRYFQAPRKFLGNLSRFYGNTMSFDLKHWADPKQDTIPFDVHHGKLKGDVIIYGNQLSISTNFYRHPALGWTPYDIRLSETAEWKNFNTERSASKQEILTILNNVASIRIRAEYVSGRERCYLDNVVIR